MVFDRVLKFVGFVSLICVCKEAECLANSYVHFLGISISSH
jgi:hypothetical protein